MMPTATSSPSTTTRSVARIRRSSTSPCPRRHILPQRHPPFADPKTGSTQTGAYELFAYTSTPPAPTRAGGDPSTLGHRSGYRDRRLGQRHYHSQPAGRYDHLWLGPRHPPIDRAIPRRSPSSEIRSPTRETRSPSAGSFVDPLGSANRRPILAGARPVEQRPWRPAPEASFTFTPPTGFVYSVVYTVSDPSTLRYLVSDRHADCSRCPLDADTSFLYAVRGESDEHADHSWDSFRIRALDRSHHH